MRDGTLIPLSKLNLIVVNRAGHYNIKGRGYLAQTIATNFQLLAYLTLNPYSLNKTTGQAFFSVQHLLPAQWQTFSHQSRFHLLGGKGDVQLWADIAKGQLKSAQTRLHFHRLSWIDNQTKKNELIPALKQIWRGNQQRAVGN